MWNQVPDDFRFALKVTDDITIKKFPNLPRFGARAGTMNPNFLNADMFKRLFLNPCEAYRSKIGPLSETANFTVSRFLLKPGRSYEDSATTFERNAEIKEPNEDARTAAQKIAIHSQQDLAPKGILRHSISLTALFTILSAYSFGSNPPLFQARKKRLETDCERQ